MTTTTTTAPASGASHSRSADVAAFIAGGLAAALGIALSELIAGLVAGAPSLVIAIGDTVISAGQASLKEGSLVRLPEDPRPPREEEAR